MIKLLHIGLDVKPTPIWISKALKQATDYREILPSAPADVIKKLFDHHQPDCVFMQIQREGFPIKLVEYMASRAVVINWSGDVRADIPQWYFDFNKFCVTCFSNMRDVKQIGGEFLQIGIDPEIYQHYPNTKGSDIVFMANFTPRFPLSDYRMQVVNFLKAKFPSQFRVFGGGWPRPDGNFMHNQVGESHYYSGSKIAISISQFDLDRYFSDRLIRAMGSGCFTLSHKYTGIEKDFKIGKHLDVFKDPAELEAKINYYLANPDHRKRIAQSGYEHVQRKFTSHKMARDILRIYEKHKPIHKLVSAPGPEQATRV